MKSVIFLALCVASTWASLVHLQSNPLNRAWNVLPRSSELASTEISFLVHLRQCNVDELEQDFWAISDPDNARYRQFKTLEEINSQVVCDELDQMMVMKHFSLYAIKVIPVGKTALRVICTVEQAEEMLNTDFAEFKHSKSQKVLIRQIGGVYIPSDLAGRIEYISSISDFFHGGKYTPITGAREKFLNRNQVSQQTNGTQILSDLMVQPKLIRKKYQIPDKHLNNSKSSIGIGAFGNSYSQEDLCRFQDLFNDYEAGSTVNVLDVPLAGIPEGVESDLDVQYSTAISRGITEQFADYGNGAWIIDWATGTVQDSNRALVWSLSYGFPEVWQCDITNNTDCNSGYVKYITLCNQEFMKLGNLGVTVMVAAGDDGTPGYATNCPLDPNTPMAGAYTAEGSEMSCQSLLGTTDECQCAGVLIELITAQGTEVCPYPVGFLYAGLGQVNYTCDFLDSSATNYNAEAFLLFNETYAEFLTQEPAGCISTEASMAAPELGLPLNPFYSTCSCDKFQPKSKTVSGNTITIKPYTYSPDNGPAFLPDFPTSSPYVVSVGATAMSYSTDPNSCRIDSSVPEIYCSTVDPSGYSGGGGFSSFQTTFSAQTTAVQKYLSTAQNLPPSQAFNANGRAYPDVAALGHNFVIISVEALLFFELPEQIELVGGTSAASPTFAGMVARLNDQLLSKNKSPLGYLNPLLYKMAAAQPDTFTDIVPQVINTFGVNVTAGASSRCTQEYCCEFGFDVTTGWDPATGLGTPNYEKILSYINQNL